MKRHKIIRALMTTVVALFFLSATAAGKVEVIGDGSQGTVDWKAEGAVITLTVTPAEGHFIRKSDITLTKTYMPTAAPRRAEVPIGDGLTLVGADPDDLSLPRTYTVTMPGEEYDLLVKLQFSNCQAITESMVRLSETVFVYNEDAQRPKVFINGLTEDKDFTVTYDNPASTATGEYGITIKGRSTWTGTVRRTYKIFAGGKAEVNKSIAGGTIATAVDGLTVTLTVTPTDGYYIRKQDIAVAKTYMPVAAPRRSIPVADRLELTGDDPDDLSLPRTYTAQLPGWEYSVYVDATFTERQTITEGMVALSATSFVYNTNDQKPVISVTGLTEGKDYLVAYNGTSWTDVDTYKVTITGRSTWKGTINRTWSITKAPSEVTTAPKTQSLIYTKTAQQLVSVGDAIGGTLVYGLDSTALQTVIPKGVNAGNYTVYYKVVGDANHFDSKVGSVPVTIDKKAVVVSGITAQNKVFDRTTAVTFLYDGTIYSGIVEGDVLSITAEGAFADTNAAVDKVVNITSLTLGGASIANYQLAKEGQQTTTKATITPKSIEGATVADIPAQLYTGQPVLPEVHVTLDEVVLVAGTDYTTEGTDNVSVGTATLTVKGKGNYQNSIQKTFTIGKKAIVISGIAAQDKVYDGTTTATLIYDEVEFEGMAVGDTLTVTAVGEFTDADAGTGKEIAISQLTLGGSSIANYQLAEEGQQTIAFADITPKSIEGATISNIPEQAYTGSAITPEVSVILGSDTLVLDKDYTVAYSDNIEAGTATVTATGKGNYQNSVQQHFTINKVSAVVTMKPKGLELEYTGEPQILVENGEASGGSLVYSLNGTSFSIELPTQTNSGSYDIYYKVQGDANHLDTQVDTLTSTIGKKPVVVSGITAQDKVYDGTTTATLVYDEVEFAGMAVDDTLTVTAFGEFANADAGTEKTVDISQLTLHGNSVANYKLATDGHQATTKAAITPKSIEGAVVSDIPEQPYTGQACTPPVIVTLDKDTLVLDKDYTVAYTDNIEAGTATVTATGKGNYQNSVQQHFTIGKKAVAVSGITAEDKVYDGTTTATLNYDAVVFTGLAEGDTLTVTAIGTFADANAGTEKVVSISQLTLGGTSITNYVLSADGQQTEAKATITPRSIQDGAISNADSLDYTGQPLTPEVSVTLNGDTLKLGNDYTLDYADNVNAGNATITATGIGNYQDNIQKTFVINKVPSSVVTAPKALALDYTGQEQTLIVGGEASGGTMVYSTNGTTFDTSLPTATDEGLHKVYYKVQGDINHLDTQVDTLTCSITPKLVDNSGNEVDADFIEGENGNTEVVVNTLPEGFYEDTSKLSTTVSDENNNSYQVTQVNAEAFNEMPNDILVVLPEGVSTTEGVTNVVNGDGTCETMDLTDVDNYNVPIDVAVDNVIYTREVEGNEPISVCLPYDADVPEGYNAYSMQLNTANEIVMNLVTSGKMEAYQPYLLQSVSTTPSSSPKRRTEGVEKVTLSAQNVTIKPSAVGSVTAGNFELRGTVSRMTHAEGVQLQAYILQSDQSWKMTASSNAEDADKTYLSAFQAYLLYHGEGELTEISIPLEGSGEATAIIVIKNDGQQKRYYNLNGQRVNHPVKGINIVDGKKVIVK